MTDFQDAKDSFYLALRDRLAALNPDRSVVVRGATRPAVLVAENEMEAGDEAAMRDTLVLHWGALRSDATEAMPLEWARCEIRWTTAGSPELAGMDRGRTMAALQRELRSLLVSRSAAKKSYAAVAAAAARTPVFWTEVLEERVTETAGELTALCAVEVFAWKELP